MKHNQKYIIPFNVLNDGKHNFSYKLDRYFLDFFEVSEIKNAELYADVQCIKNASLLNLEFRIRGYIEVRCDLCLDYYPQKIDSKGNLYIRFGEERIELSDELLVIPFDQSEIEISQYLFDFSMLGIPFKKQHVSDINGQSACDPEMIKILRKMEIKEENSEYDPRWNNLKKIK